MSLALYRTYRPGKFADVIGQEHVTTPLMRALASDRTHHAYLFSGPRGCGKTSSARILARSLNCAQGPTAEPCGVCPSCIDLAPNGPGSLDVIELDAASNRGIDQARELREQAMYAPAGSRYRIYIIDEAHQLTTEAANALLKLVEEPPAHLRFVFATTEPEKLLGTIRSRTHHYPFRLVPTSVLQEHLARVCEAEGVAADPAALALAAKSGAGSVRDALSVLGQLVGGAGDAGITYEDAVKQLGYTADSLLDEILGALANKEGGTVFRVIDDVVRAGHDPRRFATDLLERLRDLIVLKAAPDAATHGLIHQPADRLAVLADQAEAMGIAELSRAADLVSDGLSALRGATAPRLHLELLAARLLVNSEADASSLAARLEGLERKIAQGDFTVAAVGSVTTPAAPTPTRAAPPQRLSDVAPATASAAPAPAPVVEAAAPAAPAAQPEPVQVSVVEVAAAVANSVAEAVVERVIEATTPPAPEQVDMAAIQALWPAAVELIKTLPTGGRLAWMSAQSGWPVAATPSELTIAFDNMGPFNMAKSRSFDAVFAQAANQVMGRSFKVVFTHDASLVIPDDSAPAASMTPQPVAVAQHVEAEVEEDEAPAFEPRRIIEEVAAEVAQPAVAPEEDIPSDDDPVSTSASGAELLAEMLGAHVIDEYEEKSK
ncbi:MAG: hypothetical protein RL441_192 [Actinomycetota bacterium]